MEEITILNKILDILFPQTCGICGKLNDKSLCKKCEKLLNAQSSFNIDNYNENFETNFNEHLYIFEYQGIIRKKILEYKFHEKSYLYKTFANFILKNKNFCEKLKKYDIIIPIPISKKRYKFRGYNQSLLIAKYLSKMLNIELAQDCIFKTKNIVEQSKLNKQDRLENIIGVYELKNKYKLENKKILIFDDIFTTGSTVNECSKILRQASPTEIGVLTLAKD